MIEVSEVERDMYGVEGTARLWQPGDELAPAAEPPGAVNIATEWTTPRAGTTHFLVNGRIIRNEWQPAGVRLGIGVSYPLEPSPPPVLPIIDRLQNTLGTDVVWAGPGAALSLTGRNFGVTAGTVTIAGIQAKVTTWASDQVRFIVPAVTETVRGPVRLVNSSGQSAQTNDFEIRVAPPPPGPVEVESCTLAPTSVLPGESATLTVRLKAPAPEQVTFSVSLDSRISVMPTLTVIAGQSSRSSEVKAALGASGSVPITISREGFSDTVSLLIRTPPPPTPDLHNVKNYGAKGDGTTRDDQAVQQAVLAAQPGHTVYFPAGRYNLLDPAKVYKNGGITFTGDGERSVILHGNRVGLQLGTGGQPYRDLVVRGLAFEGLPGKYMKDFGNGGHGVQIYGPKDTLVADCWFRGSGTAVFNAGTIGTTYGTIIRRIKVNGWGAVALFLNGGEVVTDCELLQDDPKEFQENSSHGIYIHSGCDNVLVERVLISKARKYGVQLYGQDPGTTIEDVILRDVTLRSCANGLTLQQSAPDRARVQNLLVERLTCADIYAGPALSIKQGDSAIFRDIRLGGRSSASEIAGLQLGLWAPYEASGFSVNNMTFERPVITDVMRGIWAMQSFSGKFSNVRIIGPVFERCRKEVDLEEWGAPDGTKVPVTGLEIVR